MTSPTAHPNECGTDRASSPDARVSRARFLSPLLLLGWCGLVAGLLEVGTIVLRKRVFDADQLYKMSRHFVWLIPLSNVCVFLALGLFGSLVILLWPRRGRWLMARGLCGLTLLPSLIVAFPRIYCLAWLAVALGAATRIVPIVERNRHVFERVVLVSLPVAAGIVGVLAGSLWVGDRVEQARENAQPLPPPGSPNVLLIVLDTVAAGHLSLYGYERATTTTLTELSNRGIRFDSAHAASSWTLPSHAVMFTGRWPHELSTSWLTPLDRTEPTLAAFMRDRGYATAGFVGNTFYCATDSGLARGFTHYEDFIFPELTAFKLAVLVNRALQGLQTAVYFTEDWLESTGLFPLVERVWRALDTDRKGAAVVNRELLDWLDARPPSQPQRPFFAFLNYFDAHYPYQLLPGRLHRFGNEPSNNYERTLIQHWWELDKTTVSAAGVAFVTDAYDDCVADLDEQLGTLIDELDRRRLLEHTWLIIAADHGESFGEHAGIFCHGKSLYETELRVPLLVVPPDRSASKLAIKEPVSLRDVAATIADLAGVGTRAPFPGESLARFWQPRPPGATDSPRASPPFAEVVPVDPRRRDFRGVPHELSPLSAVKEQHWSYIRRETDAHEELFRLSDDPKEQHNLIGDPAAHSNLLRLRATVDGQTSDRVSPGRLSRR
jgi:arylsulfatase A-like enzyme